MSKHAYNGQRYVELFSITNQELLKKWKVLPSVKKVYDEKLRTFVYNLKGKAPVPLMQFPKDKTNVVLIHPILVFQIYHAVGANILFDIKVSCQNNLRKRITLSSNQKTARITLLSVTLPLSVKNAGTWCHLLIDLEDVVSTIWKKESFRSIGSICLSGTCSIKRIFTLRREMVQNQEGSLSIKYDQMPKQLLLSRNDSVIYNVISCSMDFLKEESKCASSHFTNQLVSAQSSSKSSGNGHFKVAKTTYGSGRRSISKSTNSSGSIPQTLSDKSEYSWHHEDFSIPSSVAEEDDRFDGERILPLLSRLSFAEGFTNSASTPVDVRSNDGQDSELPNQKSQEIFPNIPLTALSSRVIGNPIQETC